MIGSLRASLPDHWSITFITPSTQVNKVPIYPSLHPLNTSILRNYPISLLDNYSRQSVRVTLSCRLPHLSHINIYILTFPLLSTPPHSTPINYKKPPRPPSSPSSFNISSSSPHILFNFSPASSPQPATYFPLSPERPLATLTTLRTGIDIHTCLVPTHLAISSIESLKLSPSTTSYYYYYTSPPQSPIQPSPPVTMPYFSRPSIRRVDFNLNPEYCRQARDDEIYVM